MFEKLSALPNDPILHLSELFRHDTHPEKIDVGVGVFRNSNGETPVLQAVSEAEQILHDQQTSKSYVGLSGDATFNRAMVDLVFADSINPSRVCAIQAPGGSGALRISADMLNHAMPGKTIWVSDPTWGNHLPIFTASGLGVNSYPYFDPNTKLVDETMMLNTIAQLGPNDIVLLHGCCHNPTGSDLSLGAWQEIARLANEKGFTPFIDLAYQGFGDGLDADVEGLRTLAANVDEMIIASSCSKNFGLYRDRVGCAMVLTQKKESADIVQKHLNATGRVAYSMPPDHGAAIVAIILNDTSLKKQWQDELSHMRKRILTIRQQLATKLAEVTHSERWNFIAKHRGMFTLLCLTKAQTDALINEHSIYVVSGGRVNVAGLRDETQVERFAKCLAAVAP